MIDIVVRSAPVIDIVVRSEDVDSAVGNGILAVMAFTGTWLDEYNGVATEWKDDQVWNDGVDNNFTPSRVTVNNSTGHICGTITPLPDGGAVTYTLVDTLGGMFAVSGANIVVGATPLASGVYHLTANAANVSGWVWSVPCRVLVTSA